MRVGPSRAERGGHFAASNRTKGVVIQFENGLIPVVQDTTGVPKKAHAGGVLMNATPACRGGTKVCRENPGAERSQMSCEARADKSLCSRDYLQRVGLSLRKGDLKRTHGVPRRNRQAGLGPR